MRIAMTFLAILSFFSTAALAADDQAIKDRLNEFQSAWNKHDSTAMAEMFTEDGTLINPAGMTAKGRKEIAALIGHEHETMFKGSNYEVRDTQIQSVAPDVAIVDISANITNLHGPDGAASPDFTHHVAFVFVQKDGKWLVIAARPYQFLHKPGEEK